MYHLHLLILFDLKGTNHLFHHKISPEADKIQPFSSDLYPFRVLLEESHFYPPNLRDFLYNEASGHTEQLFSLMAAIQKNFRGEDVSANCEC